MASALKRIFEGGAEAGGRPQELMSLLGQGELTWWRPLLIPFRPVVILFNFLLRSRGGGVLPLGGTGSPRLVQTNEQVYEIEWENDRPVRVVVHRKLNEV